jgi:hypothetical protein
MGVLAAGVCLSRTSGEIALAPHLGILGRGAFRVNGQWGPSVPAIRSPLGTALLVSCEPRDRMGFGGLARQHARYKFQRNVYRIGRSFVDRRGFHGSFGAGQARQGRLFGEAHRARIGNGRRRDAFRRTARTALSRSSGFSLQHRFLSSSYTTLAAASCLARLATRESVYSPPSFGTAFEVV